MEVGTWLLKLLREGPLGGLAIGLAACVVLLRLLLREKDRRLEDWKRLGSLADQYVVLLGKLSDRRARRGEPVRVEVEAEEGGGGARQGKGRAGGEGSGGSDSRDGQ